MVYITGERDSLAILFDKEGSQSIDQLLTSLCEYNPKLDQKDLMVKGWFPPYTPLRYPEDPVPSFELPHQREYDAILRAPAELRQQYHVFHRDPEPFLAARQILKDLNTAHENFVNNWNNPLSPFEVAFPLAVIEELKQKGSKALKSHPSYTTSEKFLKELFLKDTLGQRYKQLKKTYGPKNPKVRAALTDFNWQENKINLAFAEEIKRLSPRDRKRIKSSGYGLKMYRKGGTDFDLSLSSKIGNQFLSYDSMCKLTKYSKTIGNGLIGLGAIGAGVDSYVAMQRGEDKYRPLVQWGGGMGGAMLGAESSVMFTGMATTALTGISGEAVMIGLACTPWGWVALAVICAGGAYVGSQYGEEVALSLYDGGKTLANEAKKVIESSWDSICSYAAGLWDSLFSNPTIEGAK